MTGRRRAPRRRRGARADRAAVAVGAGLLALAAVSWWPAPPWAALVLPWATGAAVAYLGLWAVLAARRWVWARRAERYVAAELEHRRLHPLPRVRGGLRWTR